MRGLLRLGVLSTILVLLSAASAGAQAYPDGGQRPPQVLGEQFFRGGPDVGTPAGGAGLGGGGLGIPHGLANTGFAVVIAVLIAGALILAGLALRQAKDRIGTPDEV